MRITDTITQDEFARYFINFSHLLLQEMNRVSNENSNFDLIGFKGLRAVGKMTLFSRANCGRISRFYDSFRIEQSAII